MNERQAFTAGLFAVLGLMLLMAWDNPKLWDVKLFEVLLQGVALTGLLNMAGAFHFTANKHAEQASDNTGKAFEAIAAAAAATPADHQTDAAVAAEQVAGAAVDEAERIKGEG